MKDRPVAELLLAAKGGDPEAIAEVGRRYEPLVRSLARDCPPQEAEDVLQEGRLALLVAIEHFDPQRGVSFGTFAQTVCRHRMAAYVARTQRDLSVDEWAISALEDATPGPEDLLLTQETLAETMRLAREVLSDMEYRVWRLRVDGYNYQEIKVISGLEDKSINNALTRARRKLKRTGHER
ncbi:MAG: sigma-70 family RNA polymerase sigma factor [Clostridia bacterium]|nr:sigma-70 family RNA polymerase sigma factor [Clostridia bacterium]